MRPKGGSKLAPKPQVGPPEPVFDHGPKSTNFGQEPKGSIFRPRTICGPFSAMASGNPHRPPAQLKSTFPLNSRGRFPIPPCTPYSRMQEWCIYGIIYHCAPFFLSNPMVMFSGPKSMIPNQAPKIHHQFQRRTLQLISLVIHGGYQKTIAGPQPPGPAGVGLSILSGLFQGPFSEVMHNSISCQGSKYSNTPWTAQLVHTGSNQSYLYVLGPLAPIHIPLWEFNTTVQFSRLPELY
ncbi:hypothetical protein O181_123314 [Austropuccinia psidii MF-1]|uniref:Uncharacterized protein n=1 Tax=Austropuccinia psidii MF-1 TaxID=1389203 RepID=A0A9Q3KPT0_9BASI|nr:hypothetical protein [Austropuccinia psidii MF-1]